MLRIDTVLTGVGGSPYYSRLHWEGTTQPEASAAVTAIAAFWGAMFTGVNPLVGRLVATVQPEVQVIDEATGEVVDVFITNGATVNPGSTTIELVPNAAQGLIRLRTSTFRGGRRIIGRLNVPCPRRTAIAGDGNVDASWATAAGNAAETMRNEGLMVYSRPTAERVGQGHIVTGISVWQEFAVLRSRRD